MEKFLDSGIDSGMKKNLFVSQNEIDICTELLKEAESLLHGKFGAESLFQNIALGIAVKTVKSFRAIVNVAEQGLGEPATIILRSIFEDLVNLKYIENDKERRAALFIEYTWVELKTYLDAIEEFDPEYVDLPRLKKHFTEKIEPEYLRVVGNYLRRLSWSGKDLRAMAKEAHEELAKNYAVVYRYSSGFTHGSPSAIASFLADAGDGEQNVPLFQPSTSQVAGTIALAFSLTAICLETFCTVWDLDSLRVKMLKGTDVFEINPSKGSV